MLITLRLINLHPHDAGCHVSSRNRRCLCQNASNGGCPLGPSASRVTTPLLRHTHVVFRAHFHV